MKWRVYEYKTQPEIECEIVQADGSYVSNSGTLIFNGETPDHGLDDPTLLKAFRIWYKVEIIKEQNNEEPNGEQI
jgi:hypothetical protein